MWYGDHMNGWAYGLMGVTSLLFWTALVLGAIALSRHLRSSAAPGRTASDTHPEQVLADRYARGDIDDEEYHRRLDTLRGSAPYAGVG